MEYDFRETEKKWQKYWADNKTFKAENNSTKPKYYVLDMFPYPSGAGLHVGHPLGYIASDIFARYKRLKGFNVLHPMGYDSFGLPAEQYAIQTGQHPKITTEQNIKRYREQLDKIGFSFDWDREVRTSDPKFYKWTQWIFLKLFNSWYNPETNRAEAIETLIESFRSASLPLLLGGGQEGAKWDALSEKQKSDVLMHYRLAYLDEAWVNWCPQLGTVLANDEVKDGVSERGGYPVERKLMPQWSLRITAYAERLLKDLDTIDWTEAIKEQQRNWIGKSEGTSLRFTIYDLRFTIEVFTTRPDTVFGVSFVTLAPEHDLVSKIVSADQKKAVEEYVTYAKNRSERERQADVKKVTGVFTGAYVEHPFTGKKVPIWIGDYVLAGYGTGAVMGVPAHDERDYAFATHFGLDIIKVIEPPPHPSPTGGGSEGGGNTTTAGSYDEKAGTLINSDFLNGLEVKEAIKKCIAEIEKKGLGKGQTNYRLRDAIFGRQRYWGEPIPIYYKDGIPHAVEEKELPVILPEVDKFVPTETGEPPLARATNWKYKGQYEFEKTTMPGWAGSSWYYLRYMDAKNEKEFASADALKYWENVDLYIGGAEHATGHLLYVRFWTKFLQDLGLIKVAEPAKKLINQGMIQGVSEKFYLHPVYVENGNKYISDLKLSVDGRAEKFQIPSTVNHIYVSADIRENNLITVWQDCRQPRNLPIEFTENSVLKDRQRFIDWHLNDPESVFACLGGYWYKEGFYPYKEGHVGSRDFRTMPEVEKMSKSKYNVVSPDDICQQYGADCLRLYEMFLGPLEQSKPWNTNGISGVSNFIRKLWRLYHGGLEQGVRGSEFFVSEDAPTKPELKSLHKTIKKITEDIDRFSFNTSVSNFMICVNELTDLKCNKRAILEPLAIIISPYAPHVAEELWERLGHKESISFAKFPDHKEEYLVESSFNYPISVNGKTKFFYEMDLSLSQTDIEKEVLALEQTQKFLEGRQPKRIIIVPNKIVNIVI